MKTLFTKYKVIQAVLFLMIPLILVLVHGKVLDSVSAYVNHTPVAFSFMLTLAGSLFIYDGVTDKDERYNIYIGTALYFVVVLNHLDYPVLHYLWASVFFIGSIHNMLKHSKEKGLIISTISAIIIAIGILGCYLFKWYSIFWAEWIGMVPISIVFILKELNKIR